MTRLGVVSLLSLSLLLSACGGGGEDVVNPGDGDTGGGVTDDTPNAALDPAMGTGTGDTFQEGQLEIATTDLSAGGSTQILATIVDADNGNAQIVSEEYLVTFSSVCESSGLATFSRDEVSTTGGTATVTYTATGCSGTDTITFNLYDPDDTSTVLSIATGTLEVAPAEIGAISYVSADSSAISISTISNPVLPQLASLVFRVVDRSNNPVANKSVSFSLTNTKGGLSLALDESVTNEDGEVTAVVKSGSAHTVTSVIATTLATDGVTPITTSSQPVSVTTGIADQDSFEIVASVLNPGAYNVSGVAVNVTAFVGDQFQNPVADGTIVNFTAESGLIDSFCTTAGGSCSVIWTSSGYRPGQEDDPDYDALDRVNDQNVVAGTSAFGITTILGYTEGEAGFTDSNNNGQYDVGEVFESFPEAIRDDDILNDDAIDLDTNSNGPVEFFADYNSNDQRDAAPSVYQGTLCSDAAKDAGHCAQLMDVRDTAVISQSAANSIAYELYTRSGDNFTVFDGDLDLNDNNIADDSGSFYLFITDENGAIAESGTTVASGGDGYDVSSDTGEVGNSIGELPASYTGLYSSFGSLYQVSFAPDGTPKSVSLTIESGSGEYTLTITLVPSV
tara:strand:+ start:3465 stop:5324 length:1860 start_codon:yes stop_codon:yes gene_type:complete